jgi:hypothetical protein
MVQRGKSGDVYNRMRNSIRVVGHAYDMRCGCIGMALWILWVAKATTVTRMIILSRTLMLAILLGRPNPR